MLLTELLDVLYPTTGLTIDFGDGEISYSSVKAYYPEFPSDRFLRVECVMPEADGYVRVKVREGR